MRSRALLVVSVLICACAQADEDLILVDDFLDPSLRGAHMCPLPLDERLADNEDVERPPCKPRPGTTLTDVDFSAGAASHLTDNLDFVQQDVSYAALGLHRYFEVGKSAIPMDLALNATYFDPFEARSDKVLKRRLQARAGLYSLLALPSRSSTDEEVVRSTTARTSLGLKASYFERHPAEYVSVLMTRMAWFDATVYASYEYEWGSDIHSDFRLRYRGIYELTSWASEKFESSGGRLQCGFALGGGVEGGDVRWLPFTLSIRTEHDLGRSIMLYGGYAYSYRLSSTGRESGDNSEIQLGFYVNAAL